MIQSAVNTYLYRLGRRAYMRTSLLAWLLFGAFLLVCGASAWSGARLLPTYPHTFTPCLKWQDALVTLCWFISFSAMGGCVLIVRFLFALRTGRRKEMLVMSAETIEVRDLSPENLSSIFWLLSTAFACFVAALAGLLPEMLLAWTLHLASPLLAGFATFVMLLLSIAALAITLPALLFVVIGLVGSISFCRNMGSPHLYHLSGQTSLSIDRFVLTIVYPDAPEAMLDLDLLDPDDARHLLHLLHERWLVTQGDWNPSLGDEIEAALAGASADMVVV